MTESEFDALFRSDWGAFVTKVLTGGIAAIESDENYGLEARRVHRHGTRCSARHDFFVALGKQEMQHVDGVRYCETEKKDLFIFGDRIAASFNLLGKNHLVRPNKTSQWNRLHTQRLIPTKDLPPELLYVIAGYTVNDLGNPSELWLTCPDGRHRNQWERRLSAPPMGNMLDTMSPSAPKPPNLPYRFREDVDEVAHGEEKQHGTDGSVEEYS